MTDVSDPNTKPSGTLYGNIWGGERERIKRTSPHLTFSLIFAAEAPFIPHATLKNQRIGAPVESCRRLKILLCFVY